MRKLRDDSTWNRLTPEQRDLLEGWLFDENLGYTKTLQRVRKVFGFTATVANLGRYYRRRARERQIPELLTAQLTACNVNQMSAGTSDLCSAAVKLVGKAALQWAAEKPDHLDQLASLTRILLESEDTEIRRARLRLAEKCFDFEAVAASQKELPQLRAYLSVVGDDQSLSHEEKLKRTHAILFGWDRAKTEPKPPEPPVSGN